MKSEKMKKSFENIISICIVSVAIVGITSCSENDIMGTEGTAKAGDVINVGGIETDEMTVTSRAAGVDAETVSWLVQPLEQGLDITYGLSGVSHAESMEDVAILKLTDASTNPATYTFYYRQDAKHTTANEDAIWHNNGFHYFQGVHVPERIRYTSNISEIEGSGKAPGLTLDQHNDKADGTDEQLGNYTLLAHYLGMPANYKLTATIERIKLPFRHRLARVVAFVLIDPELNTTLKGYKKDAEGNSVATEDPNTTSLRFCNVRVLQGVKDVEDPSSHHHTLTPQWKKERKVIPHFDGERGSYSYKTQQSLDENFKMYVGSSANKTDELYPTSTNWKAIHDDKDHKGYKEINYGKVPVYDIIVRPTYTSWENVMYDEEGYNADSESKLRELANVSNSIDFEIELENGLRYEKTFEFDLNANYQTVVYLRISKEKVDYDDAGSELWIEEKNTDAWYGVDNENGNTLSMAGSSWQRAYRSTTIDETAGTTSGVTDGDLYNNGEDVGQYLGSTDKWAKLLLQACEGGAHHGDYFILDEDITINAQDIPANFVFTGHLDAQDHTITLTGTKADTYEPTTDYTLAQTETLYNKVAGSYVSFTMPEHLYVCEEVAQIKPRSRVENIVPGDDMMTEVHPTLADVMANDVVYYVKDGSNYTVWNPRSWTFYTHRISAGSLFCGLDGTYITAQEEAEKNGINIYKNSDVIWEANVHKESNNKTVWVPTLGYRAEVLNAKIKDGTLFTEGATVTGNVQNCFEIDNNNKAITNNPDIPKYK